MKLGILGTGHVASTLGTAWSKSHDVTLGSRDPDSSKGSELPVKSLVDTIRTAEIVVNATLGSGSVATLSAIETGVFEGKTLVDVANATTPSIDLIYPNYSLAEKIQEARPDARVVKSMNTAAISTIANPGIIGPSSVFLSGNDARAKEQTAGLLRDLGWSDDEILDLGDLQTARGPEQYVVLFWKLAGALKTPAFNIRVVR